MSFIQCIRGAAGDNPQMAERADEVADMFSEQEAEARQRMDPQQARVDAARQTAEAAAAEFARRKRLKMLQAQKSEQIGRAIREAGRSNGVMNEGSQAEAFLARDEMSPFESVETRYKNVRQAGLSIINDVIFKNARRAGIARGQESKARLENVELELHGRDTRDTAAREQAEAVRQMTEYMRQRFNAAGGAIPKLENWGITQTHDSVAIANTSRDEWKAFVRDRLDREKVIDRDTGKPMTDEKLEIALNEVYESITTEGFNSVTPNQNPGGRSLANRRIDPRFLAFTPEGAQEYRRRFGSDGDILDQVTAYADNMARDIAMMEILGPNPNGMLSFMRDTVRKSATERGLHSSAFDGALSRIDREFDELTGKTNSPLRNTSGQITSLTVDTTKNVVTSALIGSASITALFGDRAWASVTARMNGFSGWKATTRMVRNMANPEDQRLAERHMLIAPTVYQQAAAQARFVGDTIGTEWSRRLVDSVVWASGLDAITQAGRSGFAMELAAHMADQGGKRLDQVEPALQEQFRNRGITPADWDAFRTAAGFDNASIRMFSPRSFLENTDLSQNRAQEIANKFMRLISEETEAAVPSNNLQARAMITGRLQKGTFLRALVDSGIMFKAFASTVSFTHGRRFLRQQGPWNKFTYFAQTFGLATMGGAFANQLLNITAGRDPQDSTTAEFWAAAALKGGGLGIFGDLISSGASRGGVGFAGAVAGPLIERGGDVLGLTVGNINEAIRGKDTNVGLEALDFVKSNVPPNNLWYAQLAFERAIINQLEENIDPVDTARRRSRLRNRLQRDFGQEFFFGPGQSLSEARAPDFREIAGE